VVEVEVLEVLVQMLVDRLLEQAEMVLQQQ
jgi:hypothetical protein